MNPFLSSNSSSWVIKLQKRQGIFSCSEDAPWTSSDFLNPNKEQKGWTTKAFPGLQAAQHSNLPRDKEDFWESSSAQVGIRLSAYFTGLLLCVVVWLSLRAGRRRKVMIAFFLLGSTNLGKGKEPDPWGNSLPSSVEKWTHSFRGTSPGYVWSLQQLKSLTFGKGKAHPAPQGRTGIYLAGLLIFLVAGKLNRSCVIQTCFACNWTFKIVLQKTAPYAVTSRCPHVPGEHFRAGDSRVKFI